MKCFALENWHLFSSWKMGYIWLVLRHTPLIGWFQIGFRLNSLNSKCTQFCFWFLIAKFTSYTNNNQKLFLLFEFFFLFLFLILFSVLFTLYLLLSPSFFFEYVCHSIKFICCRVTRPLNEITLIKYC